jgi:hypothetical protein
MNLTFPISFSTLKMPCDCLFYPDVFLRTDQLCKTQSVLSLPQTVLGRTVVLVVLHKRPLIQILRGNVDER